MSKTRRNKKPPTVGDNVDLEGCVGRITAIESTGARVEGMYYYSDGGEGAIAEWYRYFVPLHQFIRFDGFAWKLKDIWV